MDFFSVFTVLHVGLGLQKRIFGAHFYDRPHALPIVSLIKLIVSKH